MTDAPISRLCIIGVGLIGGSLARALRGAGACDEIIGFGRDPRQLQKALALGVIDHAETNTQKVFAAMRAATQAGSMSEIAKIQTKFVRDQTERSVAQAREMGEMIAKFGRDAVDKFRKK